MPIEAPGYNPDHVRTYCGKCIVNLVRSCGLELLFTETSLHVTGHVWKLLTLPSRRRWPLLGPAVDALRLVLLSMVPYRSIRRVDTAMGRIGLEGRQAFVVAARPG